MALKPRTHAARELSLRGLRHHASTPIKRQRLFTSWRTRQMARRSHDGVPHASVCCFLGVARCQVSHSIRSSDEAARQTAHANVHVRYMCVRDMCTLPKLVSVRLLCLCEV
jgi:hypothetical protein